MYNPSLSFNIFLIILNIWMLLPGAEIALLTSINTLCNYINSCFVFCRCFYIGSIGLVFPTNFESVADWFCVVIRGILQICGRQRAMVSVLWCANTNSVWSCNLYIYNISIIYYRYQPEKGTANHMNKIVFI